MSTALQSKRMTFQAISAKDRLALLPFFANQENLYYYLPTELKTFDALSLKEELQTWDDGVENLAWSLRLLDQTTIGLANFEGIDSYNQTAEFGLMLLSEQFRGQGYAIEAAQFFLAYGFNNLNLHRITCRVMEGNTPSFKLVERLGFRQEGRFKAAQKRGSRWLDMYHFALLKDEASLLDDKIC